jgi:hypothetical protein
VPGVNTNGLTQYDPREAVANGETQGRQRALVRQICKYKENAELADEMGDEKGRSIISSLFVAIRQQSEN